MKRLILYTLFALLSLPAFCQIGVEGKIEPLQVGGKVADAVNVETTGNSDVQTDIDNLENSILSWLFNGLVTDGSNPGAGFLALNSATKDDATIISFNTTSNVGFSRFDEMLADLVIGDRIFLSERSSANISIKYRVTAAPSTLGTKVNVPVVRERDQGGEFTNNNVLNVGFKFTGARPSSSSAGNPTNETELENKINTLYPLSTYVTRLSDWGSIYQPEQTVGNVAIVPGYSLIADFRTTSDRFESAGVTYTAGTGVSDYSGLTDNFQRGFGFKVTAPSDKVLLSLVEGLEVIPFVDVTATGNIRANNFTLAVTAGTPVTNEYTNLPLASGTATLTPTDPLPVAVYNIPDFPVGATESTQTIDLDINILVNGVNTGAGGNIDFEIPVIEQTQGRVDTEHNFQLGFNYNNRAVTVTIGHELTLTGNDYRLNLTRRSGPADVSIFIAGVSLFRSYTPASTTTRTDDWKVFQNAGGDYVFSGEQEFIISFQPHNSEGVIEVVMASVGASGEITEMNDIAIGEPGVNFDEVQVPDDIEFRTFLPNHFLRHADLSNLLRSRSIKWAYSLARLNEITEHTVTAPIDLAAGSTINDQNISFTGWVEADPFTSAASVTVTLPNSLTVSDFDFIEVTWHTGVGTATDNDNRNYTEMGSMNAIVKGSDAEIILGGRGRGADNFGIEVTVPLSDAATTLTLDIINLNDAGGAVLPAGSLITNVTFHR